MLQKVWLYMRKRELGSVLHKVWLYMRKSQGIRRRCAAEGVVIYEKERVKDYGGGVL